MSRTTPDELGPFCRRSRRGRRDADGGLLDRIVARSVRARFIATRDRTRQASATSIAFSSACATISSAIIRTGARTCALYAHCYRSSRCSRHAPRASVTNTSHSADSVSSDATRLPTGVRLDPAGVVHAVGPMPLNIAVAPGGNRVALLLNGWSRTGVQIVDWRSGRVTQTDRPARRISRPRLLARRQVALRVRRKHRSDLPLPLDGRFRGARRQHRARSARPTGASHGTRYPAQLAFSPDGERLYVAENLADSLAVIDMASGASCSGSPRDAIRTASSSRPTAACTSRMGRRHSSRDITPQRRPARRQRTGSRPDGIRRRCCSTARARGSSSRRRAPTASR